jgi:copper transport protein
MKRRIFTGLALALVLVVALAGTALAHASLKSSEPAAGAKLTSAPKSVKIVFTEEISSDPKEAFFKVSDPSGKEIAAGTIDKSDLDRATLSATLPAGLGDGVYTVTWRSYTTDDKGVATGKFTFGVNADPGPQKDVAGVEQEDAATPTAKPAATSKPVATAAPTATVAAAAPTAAPTASTPATLPKTGEASPDQMPLLLVLGVVALVVSALVARPFNRRTK